MGNILEEIIAKKKIRLEEARKNFRAGDLKRALADAPRMRDAYASLLRKEPGVVPVIAEIKGKSPSQGEIRPDLNPADFARMYEESGARAISVLCEQDYFGGSLEHLREAKQSCSLPVLCKDFVVSTFQVLLARVYGADLVLLIVAALEQKKLAELYMLVKEMGMAPLIEVHNGDELARALELGGGLLGINNRNLATLEVNLATTEELLPLIPKDRIVISESGFSKRKELEAFTQKGVAVFLIGGSILTSNDPGAKLKELIHGQG